MSDELYKNDSSLSGLKQFTAARIALGRTGVSLPLQESLAFKLAHAHARDAVYSELNVEQLQQQLQHFHLRVLSVYSQATDRHQYLQRPDLGRLLAPVSKEALECYQSPTDIVIIIADGLSAEAVNLHTVALLNVLLPKCIAAGFTLGPLVLAGQGRVALSDKIGHILGAQSALILIGERPGLSAADSMGAYFTYGPQPGNTDERRNCISNIRPGGLSFHQAAEKIFYLIREAFRLQLSGVQLKDNAGLLSG